MRSPTPDGEPPAGRRFSVQSDQPLMVRSPIRTIRIAVAGVVAAVVCGSLAAALWSTRTAETSMDRRVAVLEGDLASRRAVRDTQAAQVYALLERYRETTCLLLGRASPGEDVQRLQVVYQCDVGVLSPGPSVAVVPTSGR